MTIQTRRRRRPELRVESKITSPAGHAVRGQDVKVVRRLQQMSKRERRLDVPSHDQIRRLGDIDDSWAGRPFFHTHDVQEPVARRRSARRAGRDSSISDNIVPGRFGDVCENVGREPDTVPKRTDENGRHRRLLGAGRGESLGKTHPYHERILTAEQRDGPRAHELADKRIPAAKAVPKLYKTQTLQNPTARPTRGGNTVAKVAALPMRQSWEGTPSFHHRLDVRPPLPGACLALPSSRLPNTTCHHSSNARKRLPTPANRSITAEPAKGVKSICGASWEFGAANDAPATHSHLAESQEPPITARFSRLRARRVLATIFRRRPARRTV